MCRALLYFLFLFVLGDGVASQQQPLTEAEADLIVQSLAEEEKASASAMLAQLNEAEVLSEGILDRGDHKLIIRQVRAPEVEIAVDNAESAQTASAPIDFSTLSQSEHRSLFLSATVYDHARTLLRWQYEGANYEAWTNVDFNYLAGVSDFESDGVRYTVFMALGNDSAEAINEPPVFVEEQVRYLVTKGDTSNEAALLGVEAILEHYGSNESELKIAYQRREALKAARKRYEAANPPKAKDLIFQYWDRDSQSSAP